MYAWHFQMGVQLGATGCDKEEIKMFQIYYFIERLFWELAHNRNLLLFINLTNSIDSPFWELAHNRDLFTHVHESVYYSRKLLSHNCLAKSEFVPLMEEISLWLSLHMQLVRDECETEWTKERKNDGSRYLTLTENKTLLNFLRVAPATWQHESYIWQ